MQVYCVFESDFEGDFLISVHTQQEKAFQMVEDMIKKYGHERFDTRPWKIDVEGG